MLRLYLVDMFAKNLTLDVIINLTLQVSARGVEIL
jgi:hypothetical protein